MHYYLKAKNLFIGDTTTAVAGILEIKDGRIVNHMDYNAPVEGEVLDAGDKLVVPGFIDAHVHLYLSALTTISVLLTKMGVKVNVGSSFDSIASNNL